MILKQHLKLSELRGVKMGRAANRKAVRRLQRWSNDPLTKKVQVRLRSVRQGVLYIHPKFKHPILWDRESGIRVARSLTSLAKAFAARLHPLG